MARRKINFELLPHDSRARAIAEKMQERREAQQAGTCKGGQEYDKIDVA